MRNTLRPLAFLAGASLLLSSLACGPDAASSATTAASSPAVQVLRAAPASEGTEPEGGSKAQGRLRAVQAWRASPGEVSALGLARAYFPELSDGESPDARDVPEQALRVRFPSAAGEALELESWGHLFRIRPEGLEAMRLTQGAAFSEAQRFFTPSGGRALTADGHWRTPRMEEYVVLDAGEPAHRMRYTVTLPVGVVGARDAGEYLELLDTREVPVLRMHGIVARDAAGQERRGTVHLRGATLQSVPADGMARYALRDTLQVEMAVDLRGLTGPVVVDPGWSSTGSMANRRYGHTATVLQSGKVLAVGGHTGNGTLSTAELYDPATGTWSAAGDSLLYRQNHTATLLPSGKVLVTGGAQDPFSTTRTAVLYEPTTGTWTATGEMSGPRVYHAAALLPSGKVLVFGGATINAVKVTKVEQYDPATGTWTARGQLFYTRLGHTATTLPSGKVLVVGGADSGTSGQPAELYDPATQSVSLPNIPSPYGHTTTLLKSGKVLIAGDYFSASAWVYDPATGLVVFKSMPIAHYFAAAASLPSGRILVSGGVVSSTTASRIADLYNPVTDSWQTQPQMLTRRSNHKAVALSNGKILLVGGYDGISYLSSAELFDSGEQAPVAKPLSVTTTAGVPVAVTLQATDANGDALTYQVVSPPAHGTLSGTAPNLTYLPAAGFTGQDSFTWKASDGGFESNLATVSITVTQPNDAPVAQSLSATTAEDTPVAVTLQATDANGDALTYQVISSPAHGTLSGTPPNLTYVPAANFSGQDSFTWRASDGIATSALTTVTLTITPVDDAPVASAFTLIVAQDGSAPVTLSGFDAEGSTLSYTVVSWPLNGWLSGTPPNLTYVPVRGFSGSDSFAYRVSAGRVNSTAVTIPITVTPGGSESLRQTSP